MIKSKHKLAGIIFATLGIIFLYQQLAPTLDHMSHGEHIKHQSSAHGVKLLGVGEMTWMWFTMALIHFLIRDVIVKYVSKLISIIQC